MLELYHDYTDPRAALAVVRCQRLADAGSAIAFVGFEAVGVDLAVPAPLPVLAALDEVAEAAAAEGVALRRPRVLPPTGLAHVVGDLAEAANLGASWRETCYRAFWSDGVDLADPGVLTDLADEAGLEREPVAAALSDPARLSAFRRSCAAHRMRGVGGVPTIRAQQTLVPGLLAEADLRRLADLR